MSLLPSKYTASARRLRFDLSALLIFADVPSFALDVIRLGLDRHFSPNLFSIGEVGFRFAARPIKGRRLY